MPPLPILYAFGDDWIFPAVIAVVVILWVGRAVTNASTKLSERSDGIRRWVVALGVMFGLVIFFTGMPGSGFTREEEVFDRLVIALVCGGLAMVGLALLIPIVMFIMFHVFAPPLSFVGGIGRSVSRRRSRKRDAARWRREQREYQRLAPDRRIAEDKAKGEKRRREDAHASALLSYSFYAAKLGNRFSREMFDEYVKKYMGDEQPVDVVEQRGKELVAIFERHLQDVQPPRKPTSIESLSQWYEQTKKQIEGLAMEEAVKEVRLIELEQRFNDLLGRHLEETEP
jgi:hypothetical protein